MRWTGGWFFARDKIVERYEGDAMRSVEKEGPSYTWSAGAGGHLGYYEITKAT
jgi:hypothetical protein